MPNWCDCKLTIRGPNRQAVLDKIKGDTSYVRDGVTYTVYFDVEKIVPRPEGLGDNWQEWGYTHWGCRNVYEDMQSHEALQDADVIYFYTPWDPPHIAIRKLASMFPENTFLREHWGEDIPWQAIAFRGEKYSHYYELPDFNRNTGRQATLCEIFCAVLRRTGEVQAALAEVEQVKALRLADVELPTPDNSDSELNAMVEAVFAPYEYDTKTIPADEEQIARLLADEGEITKIASGGEPSGALTTLDELDGVVSPPRSKSRLDNSEIDHGR